MNLSLDLKCVKPDKKFASMKTLDGEIEFVFGSKMNKVNFSGKYYLIGVQIAHLLNRETFNLYRSMKLSNIDVVKCHPEQIEELTQSDAIKRGIHSVTLIPYEQGILYIAKELKRKPRKKKDKSKKTTKSGITDGIVETRNKIQLPKEDSIMHIETTESLLTPPSTLSIDNLASSFITATEVPVTLPLIIVPKKEIIVEDKISPILSKQHSLSEKKAME